MGLSKHSVTNKENEMSDHDEQDRRPNLGRKGMAAIGAALLVLGGGAGAMVMAQTRPSVTMAPAAPVPIRSLSSSGIITIRGQVAEIYGNKFVMADGTGRALVDTGREGDEKTLVTAGQAVTVQGRFDRGFVHAAFLVGPDSKVVALGPLGGPPRPPHDGPHHGPEGAPPPPPPATAGNGAPPPPPAAPAPAATPAA